MICQTQCTSFKAELYTGVHNLPSDVLKIALYTSDATLNQDTTAYTSTGEVVGTGYTAGGQALGNVTIGSSGYTAYVSFDNPVWYNTAYTVRGALLYNSTKANRAIAVIDFGTDKIASGTFTITLPPNTATTAILRSSN